MYWKAPKEKQKPSSYDLQDIAAAFLEAENPAKLARLLKLDESLLKGIAAKPHYRQFYIPKPNGGKRLIETPNKKLMQVQKKLAYHFQAIYRGMLPPCSYGFILSTAEEDTPRDIYTNAEQHIGQKWVFGLDLKDFFHAITRNRITGMLTKAPFHFTPETAEIIARLSTFRKRLPMGAATSPVISNLICFWLDADLEHLATNEGWVYTRFADDMTFSGPNRFDDIAQQKIRSIITESGFRINEKKVRQQRDSEHPEITGLVLRDGKPDISEGYAKTIRKDIELLHQLSSERMVKRAIFPGKAIDEFRRSVQGQINFVGFVRGEDHKSYIKLKHRLSPPKRHRKKKKKKKKKKG